MPVASMSWPTKEIVSNPIINFLAFSVTFRSRQRWKTVRVCQEVIFIGTEDEHVVNVDLTYVVYEAV